jgi:hypothetical protein
MHPSSCIHKRRLKPAAAARLIKFRESLFPGAKLNVKHSEEQTAEGGADGLLSLLYSANDNVLTVNDIKHRTGVCLQKNGTRYMSIPVVQTAMNDLGWTFVPGSGRGNPGRFIRSTLQAA